MIKSLIDVIMSNQSNHVHIIKAKFYDIQNNIQGYELRENCNKITEAIRKAEEERRAALIRAHVQQQNVQPRDECLTPE